MARNHGCDPFLFPSNFPSYPSESTTPPSSPSPSPFFSSQSASSFNSPFNSSPSPPRILHSGSSSSNLPPASFGPCAACKFNSRRCSDNCYLASFLPPNEAHKLAVAESVFGSGNVDSLLQSLSFLYWSDLQNPAALLDTASNYPEFPIYVCDSPGSCSVNFDGAHGETSKKRKLEPTWTHLVRVINYNGGTVLPDDGYSWRKFAQKDVIGVKYPRSYYRCTYKYSKKCLATKQVQRSDEDPTMFEVSYREFHTCSPSDKEQDEEPFTEYIENIYDFEKLETVILIRC